MQRNARRRQSELPGDPAIAGTWLRTWGPISQESVPRCVAEELAAHILLQEAEALTEERDELLTFDNFRDAFFEDLDFEFLDNDTFDGIERTDVAEAMGITHLPFSEWFERFGPPTSSAYVEVHPYAEQRDDTDSDMPPT